MAGLHRLCDNRNTAPWVEARSTRRAAIGEEDKRCSLTRDEAIEVRTRVHALLPIQGAKHVEVAIRIHSAGEHELRAPPADQLTRLSNRVQTTGSTTM